GRLGDGDRGYGDMGIWGDGEIKKYLVMVEDGTFFYTELNGFDIISVYNFLNYFNIRHLFHA
ncbi:hypothetical protein, partial [Okeania sp. KiyG1]|uniref:hypothetical protein n=1 Tax=Okeania sp. KiyG1 TaxID=2720165 RepID=UPI001F362625